MIRTARLVLTPVTAAVVHAYQRGCAELGRLVDAAVPPEWPVFPEIWPYMRNLLQTDPAVLEEGWLDYLFVHAAERMIVGDGGFKGRPDAEGVVEIGYSLAPRYRRQGYATEAARSLVAWAFGHPEVTTVIAETWVDGHESIRVLQKLGMRRLLERHDEQDGDVIRWGVARADWRG